MKQKIYKLNLVALILLLYPFTALFAQSGVFQPTNSLNNTREFPTVNGVVLDDGRVFVCGGTCTVIIS